MKRFWMALGLGAIMAACGDSTPGPSGAGDLLVSYHAGNPDAGAMVLTISGGQVESVNGLGSQQISFSSPQPGTTRVVVIGEAQSGDLLRIRVPDVAEVAGYSVRADQVADKNTFALIDPARHTFSVHR